MVLSQLLRYCCCCCCLQALLDANDFLGLSAYGSGYPTDASQLTYRSAELPLYTLAYELSFLGIDLKAYMDRPVLYVEQVCGGWWWWAGWMGGRHPLGGEGGRKEGWQCRCAGPAALFLV